MLIRARCFTGWRDGWLARGRSRFNWEKLVDDALRFESPALVRRLGHPCDWLAVRCSAAARDRLRASVGRGKLYFGQTSAGGLAAVVTPPGQW